MPVFASRAFWDDALYFFWSSESLDSEEPSDTHHRQPWSWPAVPNPQPTLTVFGKFMGIPGSTPKYRAAPPNTREAKTCFPDTLGPPKI
jgi:hypothetical protein